MEKGELHYIAHYLYYYMARTGYHAELIEIVFTRSAWYFCGNIRTAVCRHSLWKGVISVDHSLYNTHIGRAVYDIDYLSAYQACLYVRYLGLGRWVVIV